VRRRICLLTALAAAGSVFLAGCGGGSQAGSSATAASKSATATPASTTKTATDSAPSVGRAVAACDATVRAQSTISASARTKLVRICMQAGTRGGIGLQRASAQVCVEIVKQAVAPARRRAAEANCPKP
jgi:hypothetical protein